MATIATGMMLRCVFDGSWSMNNFEIELRPYHRDCKCALHKSKGSKCSNSCPGNNIISFPKKDLWELDRSLLMIKAPHFSSQSSSLSESRRRNDVNSVPLSHWYTSMWIKLARVFPFSRDVSQDNRHYLGGLISMHHWFTIFGMYFELLVQFIRSICWAFTSSVLSQTYFILFMSIY